MKQAVMYGGGNIGRGFIGALMSGAGYEVTFIDVAEPVVRELQELLSSVYMTKQIHFDFLEE